MLIFTLLLLGGIAYLTYLFVTEQTKLQVKLKECTTVEENLNQKLKDQKKEFEQEKEKIQNEQAASNMKTDFELEISRKRLNLEKEHNEISLAKYQIDSTERIYNKIGVKELKINQFTGDMKKNLCSLLPAMASGLIPFKE